MAALRELLVFFGVEFDDSGLKKGESAIDGMLGKLTDVGKGLAAAFALDKIRDFTLGIIHQADQIEEQAARLGVSVKALEQWRYAAQFAGIAGNELDGILNRLSTAAVAGADAGSAQGQALKKLGVDVKTAAGQFKSSDVLFEEVGLALAGMGDATERTALAMQFFGKSAGARVLHLFADGADGIAKYRAEFEELTGGGMGEFADQAAKVGDELDRLNTAWFAAKVRLSAFLIPAILGAVQALTSLAVAGRKLVQGTSIVKTALVALGAVGFVKLSAMLGPLGVLIKRFGLLAIKIGLPLLLLEDLITFFDGGDSLIGRTIDKIFGPGAQQKVRNFVREVKESVTDAFSGTWTQVLNAAHVRGVEFFAFLARDARRFGGFWGDLNAAIANIQQVTWDVLTGGWTNAGIKIGAVFDGIALAFQIAWTEIKFFGLGVVAELGDAVSKLLERIPKQLREQLGLDAIDTGGTAVDDLATQKAKEKRALVAEGERIERVLSAPAPPRGGAGGVQAPITVNVPPGTPAQQAAAVGAAAQKGVERAARKVNLGTSLPGTSGANRGAAAAFKQRGGGK